MILDTLNEQSKRGFLVIRAMREDDIPKLAEIVSENYNKHCADMFYLEAGCSFYNYPFKPHFIVIESLLGDIIGCACWNTDWCSWGVFNISWVQIKKSMQNKGYGSLLIDCVLKDLKSQASLILLSTTKPDYYLKWGFKEIKKYKVVIEYDEEEIETLMALEIK